MEGKEGKARIKKLYILQLKMEGIPEKEFQNLPEEEKRLLEKKDGKYYLKHEVRRKIRVVLTGGVFDVLHAGHIYTLEKAKSFGDVLVVVVARDETVEKLKGRKPIHGLEYRVFIVNALKPVDIALPGEKDFQKTIEKVQPDIVVFGYDQKPFPVEGARIVKLRESLNEKKFKTSKIIKELGL